MLAIAVDQVKMTILEMIFFEMAWRVTPRVAVDFVWQLKNPHI